MLANSYGPVRLISTAGSESRYFTPDFPAHGQIKTCVTESEQRS
jgi:hypothetical protein